MPFFTSSDRSTTMDITTRKPKLLRNVSWERVFKIAQIGLRILAIGFSTASVVTMLTSNQEIYMHYYRSYIAIAKAHYSYSSALRYKLIVDAIVGVFALFSSIVVYKMTKCSGTEPKTSSHFYLLIVDGVMMALSISGCAAATAVGFLGLKGVDKPGISWAPVCSIAGKFCFMVALSVAFSYAAFTCITLLTLISACKLKLLAETHVL